MTASEKSAILKWVADAKEAIARICAAPHQEQIGDECSIWCAQCVAIRLCRVDIERPLREDMEAK